MTTQTVSALLAEAEKDWERFFAGHPEFLGYIPILEQMLTMQYQLRRAMELESWLIVADVIVQLNTLSQESTRRALVIGNSPGVRDEAT
jgi:hypothetical protein